VGGVTTLYLDEIYEYVVGTGATTKYYEGNALRRTGYTSEQSGSAQWRLRLLCALWHKP